MNKEIVGKNLLDKEPILTGKEPPKIIGITEKQYYEYENLQQENKQLIYNWNKLKDYLLSKHNYKTMNSYVYDEIWLKIKEIENGDSNE